MGHFRPQDQSPWFVIFGRLSKNGGCETGASGPCTPDMVLELAPRRIHRIADRDEHVLMRLILRRIAIHDDLAPRHEQRDRHMIKPAAAMIMPGVDDDPATDHP